MSQRELIRIEMFCHGALCMAVSGKCYLSLHEMNSLPIGVLASGVSQRLYGARQRY